MSHDTPTTAVRPRNADRVAGRVGVLPAAVGALLALAVAWIHVTDQGGFPGDKSPGYIAVGYYVLELVAVVLAVGLLTPATRHRIGTWLVAAAVGAGPMIGYALTRGPGLPGAMDDRGNWGEPLGVASLVVEGILILLSLACAAQLRSSTRTGSSSPDRTAQR